MLNQSDPVLLAEALREESDAEIIFTTVGLEHYTRWTTRDEVKGSSISHILSADAFDKNA